MVRFRLSWRDAVLRCAPALLFPVTLAATKGAPVLAALPAVAVGAAVVLLLRSLGADARPDGLLVRGLRRKLLPWAAVSRIEPARSFGAWTVTVVAGRTAYRLHAPTSFGDDPRFGRDLDTLLGYWVAHRGADWCPPPPWGAPAPAAG